MNLTLRPLGQSASSTLNCLRLMESQKVSLVMYSLFIHVIDDVVVKSESNHIAPVGQAPPVRIPAATTSPTPKI